MNVVMKRIGVLIILAGLLLLVIIPLHLLDLRGLTFAGLPAEICADYSGAVLITVGVYVLYRFWYRHYAAEMDLTMEKQSHP